MKNTSKTPLLLIGESFSPWTKKARWALEYCGLVYDYQEYTPTLSEPGLRWRLRQWSGKVSVPVLFTGDQVLRDSWDIACYANEMSGDERLGDMAAIKPWNELSELALAEGRTRVLRCILNNNEALQESLPAFLPGPLRRSLRFLTRDTVQRLDRQYAHLVKPDSLQQALLHTRDSLAKSDTDYLLGRFSYADITMAVVLEMIAPIAYVQPKLGPVTQRCWNDPELASAFTDLLNWRDLLANTATISYSQFRSIK